MTEIQNHPRLNSILKEAIEKFSVRKDRKNDPVYETRSSVLEGLFHDLGVAQVNKSAKAIETAAKKYNVPADLIRAIAYMETTHGFYDAIIPDPSSIRPMNIQYKLWSQLLNKDYGNALKEGETAKSLLNDPDINIDIGAKLLSRLDKHLPGFSVEAIGSLYNHLGTKGITPYGTAIQRLYDEKPWQEKPYTFNRATGKTDLPNPNFLPDRDGKFQVDALSNRGGPTGYNSQPTAAPAKVTPTAKAINAAYQANFNRDRQEPSSNPEASTKTGTVRTTANTKTSSISSPANSNRDRQELSSSSKASAKTTTHASTASAKTSDRSTQASNNRDRQDSSASSKSKGKSAGSSSSGKSTSSSSGSSKASSSNRGRN